MNKIDYPIIIKKVLPDSLFLSIRDEFKYTGWRLTNYSNGKDSNERVSWRLNEPNNKLLFQKCGSIIKLKLQKHLRQNLNLIRVHSNGNTFGQSTRFHIDFKNNDIWTFILFTEIDWNTQWGGEFVVYDPICQVYRYVPYIPNSGALIPSNWEHYGAAPNETTDNLRTTLAFSYSSSLDMVKQNDIVRYFL